MYISHVDRQSPLYKFPFIYAYALFSSIRCVSVSFHPAFVFQSIAKHIINIQLYIEWFGVYVQWSYNHNECVQREEKRMQKKAEKEEKNRVAAYFVVVAVFIEFHLKYSGWHVSRVCLEIILFVRFLNVFYFHTTNH